MTGMDPRTFRTGDMVEVCPFRADEPKREHLDGERGVVEQAAGGNVWVKLTNQASVTFPTNVLKIVPKETK